MSVKALKGDSQGRAFYCDPTTGEELDLGAAKLNAGGDCQVPQPTVFQDCVLLLEAL